MSDSATVFGEALVDPFGQPAAASITLAQRATDLDGRSVVLFDNGKLDPQWGNLSVIFDVLERHLRERFPAVRLSRISVDINPPSDNVAKAHALIGAEKPAGAVIAMVDHGVSQRSIDLACRLEADGIATCLVGSAPGVGLAAAVAYFQIPGLPIVDVAVVSSDPPETVAAGAAAQAAAIIDGLTLSPGEQKARFARAHPHEDPALERTAEGRIALTARDAGSANCDDWAEEFYRRVSEAGLGDGLPLMLPTERRVAAMVAATKRNPAEVLLPGLGPSGIPVTVERLAANAVMSGCDPHYFPVVLAAFTAMTEPEYRLQQAAITSHPGGNLLMVSGPLADRIGISGGAGCLGPAHRANLTIGRALTLTLINIGRIRPGEADLAPLGSPAEIAYCFAENRAASPWPTFNEEHYGAEATCVLVHRCEGPHTVVESMSTRPEVLLDSVASVAATLGANNAYVPAELVVILNPLHAKQIAHAGWSKQDIRHYLFDHARNPAERLVGRGTHPAHDRSTRPGDFIPIVRVPEDFIVVVAGGPGPHSAIASPWGLSSAVHRQIELP